MRPALDCHWRHHPPHEDAAGYLILHPAIGTATFVGDVMGQLTLHLHDSGVEPGDILEVHAFREDVPGFPHEPEALRTAGLSPAVEVEVPSY